MWQICLLSGKLFLLIAAFSRDAFKYTFFVAWKSVIIHKPGISIENTYGLNCLNDDHLTLPSMKAVDIMTL